MADNQFTPARPSAFKPSTFDASALDRIAGGTADLFGSVLGGRPSLPTPGMPAGGFTSGGFQRPGLSQGTFGAERPAIGLNWNYTRAPQSGMATTPLTSSGSSGAAGGEWSTLDTLNPAFNSVGSELGVPANLIKAMMAREGGYGRDKNVSYLRGQDNPIYAFNGVSKFAADSRGIDFNRMLSDDSYAVWAMGKVLHDIFYQDFGGQKTWEDAAAYYLLGPSLTEDEYGNNRQNYLYGPNGVIDNMNKLNQMAGGSSATNAGTGGTASGFSTIWGGKDYPVTFEFAAHGGPDMYGYATALGLDGQQHTGVDVGTPRGTQLYSPVSGTVTCVGKQGSGDGGGSCGYYDDVGGGPGNLAIRLDDGSYLILGHVSSIGVTLGSHVNPGQAVALSGTNNGDHVHVEYRVPDSTLPAGFRIVDPRGKLGGGPVSLTGATGGTTPYANSFARFGSYMDRPPPSGYGSPVVGTYGRPRAPQRIS